MTCLKILKCNNSVIFQGEAGCGKTSLILYLAKLNNKNIATFNLNGGIHSIEIIEWLNKQIHVAVNEKKDQEHWIFLDEINTTPSDDLLKEVFCDRKLNGKEIPTNLKIIGACNPLRNKIKNEEEINNEMCGIKSKFIVNLSRIQTMQFIVYPLHPSMELLCINFGSLNKVDEEIIIGKKIEELNLSCKQQVAKILQKIHNFYKEKKYELSAVSLRNITRFIFLYRYFSNDKFQRFNRLKEDYELDVKEHNQFPNYDSNKKAFLDFKSDETKAIITCILICYYFMLNNMKDRTEVLKLIAEEFGYNEELIKNMVTYQMENLSLQFFQSIQKSKNSIYSIKLKNDLIVFNQALVENIFISFSCIQCHIPCIICGKPGSSKTLSISIILDCLKGEDSFHDYFKNFKPVHRIYFQGSLLTKSESVLRMVAKAENYSKSNPNVEVVIFFD